jgi:PPK2 family polyphosphate:nucleotide phosphotransferase
VPVAKDEFRVDPDRKFRLKDWETDATAGYESKQDGIADLRRSNERLRELQEKLYADDHWALLVIFQAMDGAGKDSTIEHVFSGVNPAGCQVYSFKAPSSEELDHDYMWRTSRCLPERGRIGVFNRSYYEEVLIVRVHAAILAAQKLPKALVTDDLWTQRFEDINAFERYLTRNGVLVKKIFLHVSKEEQRQRFLARIEQQEKNWKFGLQDVEQRKHWDRYQEAYEDMIRNTSTEHAPWYVIPADRKWVMRAAAARIIVDALEGLKPEFPRMSEDHRQELEEARKRLTEEEPAGERKDEKKKEK